MLQDIKILNEVDTRSGFGDGIAEAARTNPNIVALTADLAGSLKLNQFMKEFPERFVQCGIGEANMMGVAAGMTIGGKIPYTTTFANFSTGRVYDQIRQSIAYAESAERGVSILDHRPARAPAALKPHRFAAIHGECNSDRAARRRVLHCVAEAEPERRLRAPEAGTSLRTGTRFSVEASTVPVDNDRRSDERFRTMASSSSSLSFSDFASTP